MPKTSSLAALGLTAAHGREAVIKNIAVDSRHVSPGTLFFALPGSSIHGAEFAERVIEEGAVAILTDMEGAEIARSAINHADIALIVAEDPRQTLAQTASLWFGPHPGTMVAVTGTNGKTSVSTFRPHNARTNYAAPCAGRSRRRGRDPCGDGGLQPRARPEAA